MHPHSSWTYNCESPPLLFSPDFEIASLCIWIRQCYRVTVDLRRNGCPDLTDWQQHGVQRVDTIRLSVIIWFGKCVARFSSLISDLLRFVTSVSRQPLLGWPFTASVWHPATSSGRVASFNECDVRELCWNCHFIEARILCEKNCCIRSDPDRDLVSWIKWKGSSK
jgi:hypothetical protein